MHTLNLLLAASIPSCAFAQASPRVTPAVPPPNARVVIVPAHPAPGSLVRLTIALPARAVQPTVTGTMAGEPLHFHADSFGVLRAIGAIPVDASDSVVALAFIDRGDSSADTLRTVVRVPHHAPDPPGGRARGARRLRVARRFSAPMDSATVARVASENARAREIGHHAHLTPALWRAPFARPRPARVTSRFGAGRLFNGRVASSHLGVDYAGKTGDPVYAANRGVVALIDTFFLAGRVIYIDHGDGLVTGYFHLSAAEVAVGDTVERGQRIGRVGATGRVTGPHLHWSARYGALAVDPGDLFVVSGARVSASTPRARSRAARRPRRRR